MSRSEVTFRSCHVLDGSELQFFDTDSSRLSYLTDSNTSRLLGSVEEPGVPQHTLTASSALAQGTEDLLLDRS